MKINIEIDFNVGYNYKIIQLLKLIHEKEKLCLTTDIIFLQRKLLTQNKLGNIIRVSVMLNTIEVIEKTENTYKVRLKENGRIIIQKIIDQNLYDNIFCSTKLIQIEDETQYTFIEDIENTFIDFYTIDGLIITEDWKDNTSEDSTDLFDLGIRGRRL